MSLGLHERRARRRRQLWWAIAKWVIALIIIGAAGSYAYYAGTNLARREVELQKVEIEELEGEVETLNAAKEKILLQTKAIARRAKDWEDRYEKEVPTGKLRDLLASLRAKLDGGLNPDRLAFLIEAAQEPHDCEAEPDTKRFIVKIDQRSNGNDSVSFHKAVVVTATGEPAVNANGQREGWFDPEKPLDITFKHLGGKTTEISGPLPLHHSLIAETSEYRFSIVPGARGFVNVTGQRCSYP